MSSIIQKNVLFLSTFDIHFKQVMQNVNFCKKLEIHVTSCHLCNSEFFMLSKKLLLSFQFGKIPQRTFNAS